MSDLIGKISHAFVTKIIVNVLGLLTLSVTAKFLGPEGRGVFVSASSALTLIVAFGSLALGNATINFASERCGHSWLSRVFPVIGGHILVATFAALVFYLTIIVFTNFRPLQGLSIEEMWVVYFIIPLQFVAYYSQPIGSALDEIRKVNNISSFAQIIAFFLVVVGVAVIGLGPLWLLVALMIRQGIVATGVVRLAASKMRTSGLALRNLRYSTADARALYAKGLRLYPGLLGAALFGNADIVMLNYYDGIQAAGIYQAGIQFVQQLLLVVTVMNIVFRGQMARMTPIDAWQEQRKVIALVFLLTFLGSVLLASSVKWWMLLILGESFEDSVTIFQWGLLSLVGLGLSSAMSAQFIGRGWLVLPGMVNLLAGMVNIFTNMWLIPKYGPLGAIWATIGSSLIIAVPAMWMLFYCERELRCQSFLMQEQNANKSVFQESNRDLT